MSSSGKACLWYFKPPDLARKREDSLNLLAFLRRSTVYAASTANQQDRKKRISMKTECTSRIAFPNPRVLIGFALYAAVLVLALAPVSNAVAGENAATELSASVPAQATGGIWTATGDLGTPRDYHRATLLPNGQVLVAGGRVGDPDFIVAVASAELYDPATGVWTPTGSMTTARAFHTATLLPNGQVLVTGYSDTAELYDPATGVWTATGSLTTGRSFHTATLLPNGQVLVAGGTWLASAELYDPATGVWTAADNVTTARGIHTATWL